MSQSSKASRTGDTRARPVWGVLLRILTATAGGYVLTSLATMLLARTLPGNPLDTAMAATLMAFTIYTAIIVWVFAARTALKATGWVVGLSLLIGAAVWFSSIPGVAS